MNKKRGYLLIGFLVIVSIIFVTIRYAHGIPPIENTDIAVTQTSTSTIIDSPTIKPTSSPLPDAFLWTPIATFPSYIADPTITAIYKNNNCRLPCWQGIIPGKTSWNDAWQFLGRIAQNEYPGEYWFRGANDKYYFFELHLIKPSQDYQYGIVNILVRKSDFIIDNISLNVGVEKDFRLQEILREFGRPNNIYYFGYDRPGGYNMWLYLYYPDDGFIASYFTNLETNDSSIRRHEVCFQKTIYLTLWPNDYHIVFPSVDVNAPEVDEYFIQYVVPIDKIADITIDEFYNNNKDKEGEVCFEVDLGYNIATP